MNVIRHSQRAVSVRRGRPSIDAYLVECLDCARRYRLTDRTCPSCGSSVDKALPLYRRAPAVAAAALMAVFAVGCGASPTEPIETKTAARASTDCPLAQKDMYGYCVPAPPPPPCHVFSTPNCISPVLGADAQVKP